MNDQLRTYRLIDVDDVTLRPDADLLFEDGSLRTKLAGAVAADATIYGLPSVLQYEQTLRAGGCRYQPAVRRLQPLRSRPRPGRAPGYAAFKTPNADTLYSNAWLDLTRSPSPGRCTLHSVTGTTPCTSWTCTATRRTSVFGPPVLSVAASSWRQPNGTASYPPEQRSFRVATPYMWILMRIFTTGGADLDWQRSTQLQHAVQIHPAAVIDHRASRRRSLTVHPPVAVTNDSAHVLQRARTSLLRIERSAGSSGDAPRPIASGPSASAQAHALRLRSRSTPPTVPKASTLAS